MRLLRVELTRYATRRSIVLVLLGAFALTVLMVASAAHNTRPADNTEQAAAEQMLLRQQQLNDEEYQDCVENPEEYYGDLASTQSCESLRPDLEWYLPRPLLDLGAEIENRGRVLLVLLAGVGILVGALFAGSDWASGSMSTQLLHEPRRLKVWLTKAVAVVLATTVAAALMLVVFWGGLAGFAAARGLSISTGTWSLLAQTSGRGLALVAAVALGSFALTMALRHTVGTLGLLFGYAVVGEGLAAALPFDKMSQWSMANNVLAWIHDGVEVRDASLCQGSTEACSPFYVLSLGHAAAYLGALLLLAVVVSVVAFRRRDVP